MDTQATNENPLSSQRQSSNAFKLRVGQFNVLNLVKENTVFYEHEKYKKETVDKKVAWITEQLKRMNATIVGFEEVFHVEVLKRATDACDLFQGGEVVCYGDGTGPSVALASRYPILDKENIVHFPKEAILHFDGTELPITKFSRPVLRCVIGLPTGHSVTVFVIHLKSKRPLVEDSLRHDQKAKAIGHAKALIIRAAEATAVRCILVNEMRNNNRPVIVLGDLNDTVHSVTTEIITGTPPWKKLSHEQKQQIWDVLLWSTNEVQVRSSDRDVTYSHIHNGRYEVLDHILVSQEFVRSNPNHIGYVQFLQLFNDHLVDETLTDEKSDNVASDHGQVVAQIKIYPKQELSQHKTVLVASVHDLSPDVKHVNPHSGFQQQHWVKKSQ